MLGLTQADLAKKLGYSDKSMIAKIEKGSIDLSQSKITAFANALNTTEVSLMGWDKSDDSLVSFDNISPISVRKIPLLGSVACGKPVFADEEFQYYVAVGAEIRADFALHAKGDSMIGARINDGDIVFVRKTNAVDNGEIAVVIIGDEATLKRVYYYPEKSILILKAENPKYDDMVYADSELEQIRILGKAVAVQADVR